MFARLAPRCGSQPVYGARIGSSDMHGGFSWSSIGHSLSSGLSRLGSFVGNAASRIGNSQAFQQAKSGFLQSGVLESAGHLAGQAVNSLVDIGRLKLESDLQRLRDRVAADATAGAPSMASAHSVPAPAAPSASAPAFAAPAPSGPTPAMVHPAPAPMPAVEEPGPVLLPSSAADAVRPPPAKRRKRKRASGWGAALDHLLGSGVSVSSKRMCY